MNRQGDLIPALNSREQAILQMMAMGKSNREIALHMELAESTIGRLMNNINTSLNTKRRADAVAEGLRWGLIK